VNDIRVAVVGARGRMGAVTVGAVESAGDMKLVGAWDVDDDLEAELQRVGPDVAVDFTIPGTAARNLTAILSAGVPAVVGTTGFTPDELEAADRLCLERGLGAVVAPNFAIGAVLLMRFAAEAARHMDRAEIVELHHDGKRDAPSGTALRTAQLMAEARCSTPPALEEEESLPGARGGRAAGDIPVHSVRLPGLVAHQEVLLGGQGQVLTIRHDTLDRSCFMPGVLLAIRKVRGLTGVVRDLGDLL
jgi:4-hydroxy-tetrahydrodipicolinate reductase